MRTTLIIDDELFRRIKCCAAEQATTVSDLVNHALREYLQRPAPAAAPFSLITYGRIGKSVDHEPADFAAMLDREDGERLR